MGYTMRTARYRYIEWQDWNTKEVIARELYDHHKDAHEMKNLATSPEYKLLIQSFSTQLKAGWRKAW